MGATLDQFDTIDFSDNDLRKLDGFPYLPRLKCLLLNNNRIVYEFVCLSQSVTYLLTKLYFLNRRISENLIEYLPNIENIILTGNNIQELGDLEPLTRFTKLESLCLLMNPVSTKPNYREYLSYK